MDYLIIIQEVIPEIIDIICDGVGNLIIEEQAIASSVNSTLTLIHQVIYNSNFNKCQYPQQIIEDNEPISNIIENYAAHSLKLENYINLDSGQPMVHANITVTSKFIVNKPHFDQLYKPKLVALPRDEIENAEEDKLRKIKHQQHAEAMKLHHQQLIRMAEARKLKEIHRNLQQTLNKTEYTYDYNCQPIIRKKSPIKQSVLSGAKHSVHEINKLRSHSNPRQHNPAEIIRNELTPPITSLQEDFEIQQQVIQNIHIQGGVKLIENNKILMGTHRGMQIEQLSKKQYYELNLNERINHFNTYINDRIDGNSSFNLGNSTVVNNDTSYKNTIEQPKLINLPNRRQSILQAPKLVHKDSLIEQTMIQHNMLKLPTLKRNSVRNNRTRKRTGRSVSEISDNITINNNNNNNMTFF